MKKAMLYCALCSVACGAAIATLVMAQQPAPVVPSATFTDSRDAVTSPAPQLGESYGASDPYSQPGSGYASSAPSPYRPQGGQLQQRYVRGASELAALLDDEELESAIREQQERIAELKARSMLRAARRALKELLDQHPQTEAAREAAKMLGEPAAGEKEAGADVDDGAGVELPSPAAPNAPPGDPPY